MRLAKPFRKRLERNENPHEAVGPAVCAAVTGYPITFAVNGKQCVAVSTGNSFVSTALNRLAPKLKPSEARNIVVFALPEN